MGIGRFLGLVIVLLVGCLVVDRSCFEFWFVVLIILFNEEFGIWYGGLVGLLFCFDFVSYID